MKSTLGACLLALLALPLLGETPLGLPAPVSNDSLGAGVPNAAASDAAGNLLVAWSRSLPGDLNEVMTQVFDAAGEPLGAPVPLSGQFSGFEGRPTAAADPGGGFLVVWQEFGGSGLNARRVAADGQALGGFLLGTSPFAQAAAVAIGEDGVVAVAWNELPNIQAQFFDPLGVPRGPAFQVNVNDAGWALAPAVAALPVVGHFVFVWEQPPLLSTPTNVYARVYDDGGLPLGPEFTVSQVTADSQLLPSVAADDNGNFLVAWGSGVQDGQGGGVFGRLFGPGGGALGPQFRISDPTPIPALGLDTDVRFRTGSGYAVAWAWRAFNPGFAVHARRLDRNGTPVGAEFRVSAERNETQNRLPRVAWTGAGLTVVWLHKLWVGPYQMFLQRYDLQPAARGDFNRDGQADLLFRNQVSGRSVAWTMAGLVRQEGAFLTPDVPDLQDWQLVATPDLDADGGADVIWWRPADGGATAWFMKELERREGQSLAPFPALAPPWRVVASADLDGDLRPDLLVRNELSGELRIRALAGAQQTGELATDPPAQDVAWTLAGAADFDADGHSDLLWQHRSTGELRVWLMRRNRRVADVPTLPAAPASLDWQVGAVADYDGTADVDIVWRHRVSGAIVVWRMAGLTRVSGSYTTPSALNTAWAIAGPR